MCPSNKNRGAALITVLFITVLFASLLVAYAYRLNLIRDEYQVQSYTEKLILLGMSAESWALKFLSDDSRKNKFDSLSEDWARSINDLPIDRASITAKIIDLNRFINLNRFVNTTAGDKNQASVYDTSDRQLISRLFQLIGVEGDLDAIDSLIDWQDRDDVQTNSGYESAEYQLLNPPYRSANNALQDVNELALVKGFSHELINKLKPYVSAHPGWDLKVNVNTAGKMVLMSLWDKIDERVADELINIRSVEPWSSVRGFVADLQIVSGQSEENVLKALGREDYSPLSTQSRHFLLDIKIKLDDWVMSYDVMVARQTEERVVSTIALSRDVKFLKSQ
jgi:general secretion pathway protein K